jgi:hypothetical protein
VSYRRASEKSAAGHQRTHKGRYTMMTRSFAILASGALILSAGAAAAGGMSKLEITFVDHIKAEMVEQDVFVEKTPGSGEVFRVTVDDNAKFLDQPVFTVASSVHHDPMNKEETGPYAKGQELGFTLGEWLGASGTATYRCADGKGAIEASFDKLAPNGVYTMWNFFLAMPFTEPFSTYDLPVGERDGSGSVFKTDGNGAAKFSASFEPCLQGGGTQIAAGLAIAYHSDGKTYGSGPGSMGDKSHVHLFALLPGAAEMPN